MPVTTVAPDKKSLKRLSKVAKHLSKLRRRQMKIGCEPPVLKALDEMIDKADLLRTKVDKK